MTTVGYGDIKPINNTERGLCILVMVIGGSVFGYIVGSVTVIMDGVNNGDRAYRAHMDVVDGYIRERQLPVALGARIRRHAKYLLQKTSAFDTEFLSATLPVISDYKLAFVHCGQKISRLPFLHNKPIAFVASIARALRPMVLLKDEYLFFEGEMATDMYYLVKGSTSGFVTINEDRVKFKDFRCGDAIGEVLTSVVLAL